MDRMIETPTARNTTGLLMGVQTGATTTKKQ
jgi:hypothetical protein